MKKITFLFFLSSFVWAETVKNLEPSTDNTQKIKKLKIKNLSDLQKLTPFESVSVIQKRYLPKTFRGEFNLSVSSVISHTFFYLGGVSARVGFFSERGSWFRSGRFCLAALHI